MNSNDNDGASGTDDPGQPGMGSQGKGYQQVVRGADRRRRDSAVMGDAAVVLSREKSATVREDAADSREHAADLREEAAHQREGSVQTREGEAHEREGAATAREREIRAAATREAASGDRMLRLQQANAHLVIASIEAQKLTEQVRAAKVELDHLAHHDVLTDLPNRLLLQDRLSQAIELARRQRTQLAVMFMDLDQFKHINDSLGHSIGDQLLQSVAQRLVACVRQSDTVSRQGGDEFVLLLPHIEHAEDAALSAQKLLAALVAPHRIDQHDLHISVSIGISIYPDDGQDAETLIKNADTAMYHAKEYGRNNYKFFEQSMNARAVLRQSVEASLRRALERQEFVLHYQPKINLHSGTIVGVEALIRWQHPELGLLLPAHFVPIAEECGLILPIGRWVLRTACLQAQAWRQAGLPPIIIAVNTSALEFRAKDFLEYLRTVLAETGLNPACLELELTESVLMHDVEFSNAVLPAIADLGVMLAVDDFGTGYSSLSYLKLFPIDTLKIDQSFVNQITTNPDDATIVSAVIGMGKSLRLRVIAEGVETPEQYAFLLTQQCDVGQGYYFSHPMTAEAIATLLHTGISITFPN
ncbi:putative bifunctional diguanylate cyclase/phosphodiesterase [Sulfuriferula sp. GW1]|uniref:putative bifunctional diguanylate cyclase/phosphodiesterase n=1 Tax=Sulfuriferula sp. GW1 TaxID=3345111 RepID=UPI0039AF819C